MHGFGLPDIGTWVLFCLLLQGAGAWMFVVAHAQWTRRERASWRRWRNVMSRKPHPAWWAAAGCGMDLVHVWQGHPFWMGGGTVLILGSALAMDRAVGRHLRWESRRRERELDHWRARIPAEQWRNRQAQLLQLELAEYQAKSLRHLMDPHFLFNALNGVMQQLMQGQRTTALAHLRSFRRLAVRQIRAGRDGWWSLGEEWRVLEDYIGLELQRLQRPVTVELVPLKGPLSDAAVPALMVQPLVENALWHGIGGTESMKEGQLRIEASCDGAQRVRIEVSNSTHAERKRAQDSLQERTGRRRHATDLIQQRLRILGVDRSGGLQLSHGPNRTTATLSLPVRDGLWTNES